MHIFHTAAVLGAGGDNVNPRGIDAAVTENICKLGNILFNSVEHTGEQVAQVMRKHLLRIDICLYTECFHLSPDIRAAYGFACAGHKNHTAFNSLLCCIAEQFLF